MALKHIPIDSEVFLTYLRSQVKGQDPILKDLATSLQALESAQRPGRPMASFLFVGPHGVGKSELAKAVAKYLFEDEVFSFHCVELRGPSLKALLVGAPVGYIGSERGGMLTRPVLENPRRLFCVDEIQLIERGSDKIADFSQCILIFTSSSNADELKRIQQELTDYDQIVKAVEKQSAQSEFFRPLFEGGIDRVFPFRELDAKALAEIALLKFSKMAEKDFGITVEFISQQSILDLLVSNYQVTTLSVYGFEQFFYDLFADDLITAKENGARGVKLRVGTDGELSV
jgi:ATP-dependent Clp protease ATP-binding subunit ClpA